MDRDVLGVGDGFETRLYIVYMEFWWYFRDRNGIIRSENVWRKNRRRDGFLTRLH